jgi:hypothetical protein
MSHLDLHWTAATGVVADSWISHRDCTSSTNLHEAAATVLHEAETTNRYIYIYAVQAAIE